MNPRSIGYKHEVHAILPFLLNDIKYKFRMMISYSSLNFPLKEKRKEKNDPPTLRETFIGERSVMEIINFSPGEERNNTGEFSIVMI